MLVDDLIFTTTYDGLRFLRAALHYLKEGEVTFITLFVSPCYTQRYTRVAVAKIVFYLLNGCTLPVWESFRFPVIVLQVQNLWNAYIQTLPDSVKLTSIDTNNTCWQFKTDGCSSDIGCHEPFYAES